MDLVWEFTSLLGRKLLKFENMMSELNIFNHLNLLFH